MANIAQQDLQKRQKKDPVWTCSSHVLKIPCEIRSAGHKGMGLFATSRIPAGSIVYNGGPNKETTSLWLVLPRADIEYRKRLVSGLSKPIVRKFLDWCEDDFLTHRGLLCELGDEHYINSDPDPNIGPCRGDMCALRDIQPGEELLENYAAEELDNEESDGLADVIMESAGTGHVQMCNPYR
jgi:hypothetical protein